MMAVRKCAMDLWTIVSCIFSIFGLLYKGNEVSKVVLKCKEPCIFQ